MNKYRFIILSEEKTNIDIEERANENNNKKKNLEYINNIFYSLKNDFDIIQKKLEEKTKINKKLYEDFSNLYFYLEKEFEKIKKMKKEKILYEESNQDLIDKKNNFNKNILLLNYSKNEYFKTNKLFYSTK